MFSEEDVHIAANKWLYEFTDELLVGPDRTVDAIHSVSKEIERLREQLTSAVDSSSLSNGAILFKDYANKLREELIMNELDNVREHRNILETRLMNIIKNLGTSEN
tara:strand:+ start:201 stop:518 length:318 start_codon:yes stop_codon:yes gene_type:complete